jgi:hypothetical protein
LDIVKRDSEENPVADSEALSRQRSPESYCWVEQSLVGLQQTDTICDIRDKSEAALVDKMVSESKLRQSSGDSNWPTEQAGWARALEERHICTTAASSLLAPTFTPISESLFNTP